MTIGDDPEHWVGSLPGYDVTSDLDRSPGGSHFAFLSTTYSDDE